MNLIQTVPIRVRILSFQVTFREKEGKFKPYEVECVNLLQLKTIMF